MDQIFNPNFRKWVSQPLKMGVWMAEVKNLVRIHKDDLVIIDPAPAIKGFSGMSHNLDEHEAESDHPPDFMRPTALKIEEDSLLDETETEEAKQKQEKWSESDGACEAAVNKVGGEDFFLFKKKKPKDKKEKRNKSKQSGEYGDGDDDDEDEDDEDMDQDDDDQPETSTSRRQNESEGKLMDTRMYEEYNYEQASTEFDGNVSFDEELRNLMAITDANERREISLMIPEALKESDEEEGDWLDDETDNFAGDAQRYEDLKQMIENGSDDSEDEKAQYSTDEEQIEEVEQRPRTTPDDGQTPGPSRTLVKMDAPLRSAMKKGENRGKKDNKRVTICGGEEKSPTSGRSTMMSIKDIKREPNDEPKRNTAATDDQNSADIQDSTADFKRFTEWVFSQNSKRDKEYKKAFRPDLMRKLNLNEDHVRICQTLTR